MTQNDDFQLDLLVPWDLPIAQQLSEAHQAKLSQTLRQILAALQQPNLQAAVVIIQDTLEQFNPVNVYPAKVSATKTALASWEVEDFDNHFGVNHVQTPEPAFCLVRSLLLAIYRMLLLLNEQQDNFDLAEVEMQRQGYVSYVYLLSRVFNLNLEEA